jgi:cytochrome c556
MKVDLRYLPHAIVIGAAVSIAGILATPLLAQAPAAAPISQARQSVEARRAIFTLIGANFRPLGAVLKGEKPYDGADAEKQLARIVFLSTLLDEAFPDSSNIGLPDTKTKAEAWSDHDDFTKKLREFQSNVASLQKVNSAEKGGTDAFKAALKTVAQNCKGCHDTYKEK